MTDDTAPAERTMQLSLAPEMTSVREARRFVEQHWPDLPQEVLGDVEIIVTELVANAIRHGEPEILLRLRSEPFAVDIAVLDHGTTLPPCTVELPPPDRTSGRGLAIVDQLAARWGFEPFDSGAGKTVWASVALPG